MPWKMFVSLLMVIPLCCCQKGNESRQETGGGNNQNQTANVERSPEKNQTAKTAIKVTSPVFEEGGTIPQKYTCDGDNVSPPLGFEGVPAQAKTMAIVVEDPDAPAGTWTHWVLYDLPGQPRELQENVPKEKTLPGGIAQGTNDFKKVGYNGPCPPQGNPHRYYFKVYALDAAQIFEEPPTRSQLLKGLEGHILAEGQLMGRYGR